jgi:Na+-driven multidrug efflux pump
MNHAIDYIRCRCLGNPFVLANFVMIGTFRAIKDARTPLYAAVLANISNLVMDILFVYGLHMGAGGAALATSLSQMLSCAILFGILVRKCASCFSYSTSPICSCVVRLPCACGFVCFVMPNEAIWLCCSFFGPNCEDEME